MCDLRMCVVLSVLVVNDSKKKNNRYRENNEFVN